MIIRALQKAIQQSIKEFPITGILGSRQVGKTTLAKAIRESVGKRMPLNSYKIFTLPAKNLTDLEGPI